MFGWDNRGGEREGACGHNTDSCGQTQRPHTDHTDQLNLQTVDLDTQWIYHIMVEHNLDTQCDLYKLDSLDKLATWIKGPTSQCSGGDHQQVPLYTTFKTNSSTDTPTVQ